MKTYVLPKEYYETLKSVDYLSELGDGIELNDAQCAVSVDDFQMLLVLINDWILMRGMDEKQNECTEYGRQLYYVHDYLLDLRREEKQNK